MYKVEQLVVTNAKADNVDDFNIKLLKAIGEDHAYRYISFVEGLDHSSESKLILNGHASIKYGILEIEMLPNILFSKKTISLEISFYQQMKLCLVMVH